MSGIPSFTVAALTAVAMTVSTSPASVARGMAVESRRTAPAAGSRSG